MGLRVVARLFDQSEALVIGSCLDAAGVPHWIYGAPQCRVDPFSEIAYDGYKIVVCDEDLEAACSVIDEARANAGLEGEALVVRPRALLSLFLFFVFPGVVAPLKRRQWRGG